MAVVLAIAITSLSIQRASANASTDPKVIEANFQFALRSMQTGKPKEAILILKRILAMDPNLYRVRLELARALYLAGDLDASKKEFLTVLSSRNIPAPVQGTILGFIRRIDANQGFSSSFEFSLVSPAGAGRKYETDVVLLDFFGGEPLPFVLERESPPSLAVRVEASARKQWKFDAGIADADTLLYLRGFSRIVDAPKLTFDEYRMDIAPGIRLSWPLSTLSIESRNVAMFYGGKLTESRVGLGVGYQRRNNVGLTFSSDFATSRVKNHADPFFDGTLFEASLGLQRPLRGSGEFSLKTTFEKKQADRSDHSYTRANIRVSRRKEFQGGISVDASVYAERYLQDTATPGFLDKRKENEYGVDLVLEKSDVFFFGRYSPFLKLGGSRRYSSISAYSYDEYRVQLGVKSAF